MSISMPELKKALAGVFLFLLAGEIICPIIGTFTGLYPSTVNVPRIGNSAIDLAFAYAYVRFFR